MAFTWCGAARSEEVVNAGPLALLVPLLERLPVAPIIDRHLPPDPQLEFAYGQVLSLLLAARLSRPTALVNIPEWATQTGADLLWDIPVDKLNDDRLGRALDAFFDQRHSILAHVAEQALRLAHLPANASTSTRLTCTSAAPTTLPSHARTTSRCRPRLPAPTSHQLTSPMATVLRMSSWSRSESVPSSMTWVPCPSSATSWTAIATATPPSTSPSPC